MKTGIGIITFVLTIIFATIAIQNNKIARAIVTKEFNLQKFEKKDNNISKEKNDDINLTGDWNQKFKKEWDSF